LLNGYVLIFDLFRSSMIMNLDLLFKNVFYTNIFFKVFFYVIIGSEHGNISVDDVLYSANTTSLHVAKLPDEYRLKIRQQLIEPLANQAVTICPDLWSDSYRQVTYLGISVCFIDGKHEFFTYDLFLMHYYIFSSRL
jgi:hypothetical protein